MTNDEEVELVLQLWSLTLMRSSFENLALAFAAVDAAAADKAIHACEVLTVQSLTKLREEGLNGIAIPNDALQTLASNYREMTQGARQQIRKMKKPN